MRGTEARRMARDLMTKYRLWGAWQLDFERRSTRRYGACSHHKRTISLSERETLERPPAEVADTLLHEIAHALVGPWHGHDTAWREKYAELLAENPPAAITEGMEQ